MTFLMFFLQEVAGLQMCACITYPVESILWDLEVNVLDQWDRRLLILQAFKMILDWDYLAGL